MKLFKCVSCQGCRILVGINWKLSSREWAVLSPGMRNRQLFIKKLVFFFFFFKKLPFCACLPFCLRIFLFFFLPLLAVWHAGS